MSQYPYPYHSPGTPYPGYGYPAPQDDALTPARRASVLMFVLAGLGIISSFCCAGLGMMVPQMMAERPDLFRTIQEIPNATPELVKNLMFVLGGLSVLVSVAMIVLGIFVRRGGKGATFTSIVLSGIAILFFIWQVAQVLLKARSATAVEGVGGICFMVVPLVLFGVLMMWLVQAARASDQVQAMRAAQQQYWQPGYAPPPYPQQQPPYGAPPPGGPYAGYTPPPPPGGGVVPRYPGYDPLQPPPPPPPQPPPLPPRGPDEPGV